MAKLFSVSLKTHSKLKIDLNAERLVGYNTLTAGMRHSCSNHARQQQHRPLTLAQSNWMQCCKGTVLAFRAYNHLHDTRFSANISSVLKLFASFEHCWLASILLARLVTIGSSEHCSLVTTINTIGIAAQILVHRVHSHGVQNLITMRDQRILSDYNQFLIPLPIP